MYNERKNKVYNFLIIILDCVFYLLTRSSIYMIWETSDFKMQDKLITLVTLAIVISIRRFQAKSVQLAPRMRRSIFFHHDSLCCFDTKKIISNLKFIHILVQS